MTVRARAEITLSRITDIELVTRYYTIRSSAEDIPEKPSTNPPNEEWSLTEPTYTGGSTDTLYFVDQTLFSNSTFSYSTVSISSSYEAAKAAWNKANNAQDGLSTLDARIVSAETSIEDNATEIALKASRTEVKTLSNNLNAYIDTSTELFQDINGWQFNWNKLIRTEEADVTQYQDYIVFQNGNIILGESGCDLKLKLGNNAIQFKGTTNSEVTPDLDATAWITGQSFNINKGEIHNSLRIGHLRFVPRPNGNFMILSE